MTVRSHLNAIENWDDWDDRRGLLAHAVAALRDLDNAPHHEHADRSVGMVRIVPDPVAAATPPEPTLTTGHCQTCKAPNHGGYVTPGCPDCIYDRELARALAGKPSPPSGTREGPREAAHCDAATRANPPSGT